MHYVEELARFAAGIRDGAIPIPEAVRERARLIVLDTVGAIVGARSLPEVERLEGLLDDSGALGKALVRRKPRACRWILGEGVRASPGHPGIHVVSRRLLHQICAPWARRARRSCRRRRGLTMRLPVSGAATRFRPRHPPARDVVRRSGATRRCAPLGRRRGGAPPTPIPDRRHPSRFSRQSMPPVARRDRAQPGGPASGNVVALAPRVPRRPATQGPSDAPARSTAACLGRRSDRPSPPAGLGQRWYMTGNYFKLYACCRHAHAAIDAFRTLLEENAPGREDIETRHRREPTPAPPRRSAGPTSPRRRSPPSSRCRTSIRWQLATGDLGRAAFEPPASRRPAPSRLRPEGDRRRGSRLHGPSSRHPRSPREDAPCGRSRARRRSDGKPRRPARPPRRRRRGGEVHGPLPCLPSARPRPPRIVHDAMALDTLEGTRGLAHAVLERPVPVPEKEIA